MAPPPPDQPHDWPNRRVEILLSTTIICVLSTVILAWRVAYGVKTKRRLMLCDYLLIVAAIINITTTIIRFETTKYALGRHIFDPSIHKPDIRKYSYTIWINQVINLIAVSILKYSICAYLLALKFSTVYSAIVWFSIAMVTVFNLVLPMVANFSCRPLEANWNKMYKGGKCGYTAPEGITYMQGVSNCVTDVVYVVAPIIYLRSVHLPRRTQWGLRIVFLLGLVVTVCSIFKTVELSALRKTQDPTWDGVNLTIWSATELSVGILIASLPPLRKQFDTLFRHLLPSTFTTNHKSNKTPGGNSIPLYNYSKQFSSTGKMASGLGRSGKHGDATEADDGDSERRILQDDGLADGKIMKTVQVVHEVEHSDGRVEGGKAF